MYHPSGYPSAPPPQPKSGTSTGAIIAIVLGGLVVVGIALIGVFAVLGVYGTRKYVSNAKQAEARASLVQIGRLAVEAYERETPSGEHALCPSSRPVPSSAAEIAGKKYMPKPTDYTSDPGFGCLKFELSMPQYFQYEYRNEGGTAFTATAHGDFNGDGKLSTFTLKGSVQNGVLQIDPVIGEVTPDE